MEKKTGSSSRASLVNAPPPQRAGPLLEEVQAVLMGQVLIYHVFEFLLPVAVYIIVMYDWLLCNYSCH